MRLSVSYFGVFLCTLALLCVLPKTGGYIWQPEVINPLTSVLFTLLVYLTGRIAGTTNSAGGVICTAVFILLFCPGSRTFFTRDEAGVMELSSICIVPFFISQYARIADKNFKYGYFLMLLMGIFCSYTHDSITIPLCAGFIVMSYNQRDRLFRMACWPMVIGFVIGTTLSLLQSSYLKSSSWNTLDRLSAHTANGLIQLWETKVFLFGMLLTIYYVLSHRRRKALLTIFRNHKLLVYCLMFSFCAIPFAPLGLDSAISGVCFFCMFWTLFLFQDMLSVRREAYRKRVERRHAARNVEAHSNPGQNALS